MVFILCLFMLFIACKNMHILGFLFLILVNFFLQLYTIGKAIPVLHCHWKLVILFKFLKNVKGGIEVLPLKTEPTKGYFLKITFLPR